jgi:hypothetical protein
MNVDLMNNMSNNEKTNKTNPKLDVKATSYCIKSQVIGPSHAIEWGRANQVHNIKKKLSKAIQNDRMIG